MSFTQTEKSVFWQEAFVVAGNQLLYSAGASQQFGSYQYQDPAADGDIMRMIVTLDPGFYNMEWLGVRGNSSAIIDVYFDGVLEFTDDRYQAAFAFNTIDNFGVTILEEVTTIDFVVNGKNASSFDFFNSMTRVFFSKL